MYQRITLAAGVAVEFTEKADFFRLLDAVPVDVVLIFYNAGREISSAQAVTAGYAEEIPEGFDKVRISSATGGVIAFVTRYRARVRYDKPPTGNVTIVGNQGAFSQSQAIVGTTSGQFLAANPNRRYLLIQNNDATGVIYVHLNGGVATAAVGIKIEPGGSYECNGFCPSGAISIAGSIASNANVVVVQG